MKRTLKKVQRRTSHARKLAQLARADGNLLAPVEHRTAEQAVIRARDALVRSRTLLVNMARSLAKGFGLRLPATITTTFGARALAGLPEHLHLAMKGLLEQIDALGVQLRDYDQRIAEGAARHLLSPKNRSELTCIINT